jgi:hypothetical protein
METKTMLTLAQVSAQTGISKETLARWCRQGKIAGAARDIKIGLGYLWRIPADAVLPEVQLEGKAHPDYGKRSK